MGMVLMKPKISIILPIYNMENYLECCMDSILSQTFDEFELICIDDGSTDSTPTILNRYAQKDSRIKMITQANQGVGIARNKGIEMAQGQFLSILDADDFFEPSMLEKLYDRALADDSDIVICRTKQYDDSTKTISNMPWTLRKNELPIDNPFDYHDVQDHVFTFCVGWAWDKLYRAAFVFQNQLKFPNLRNSEDLVFVFPSLVFANKISILDDCLVYHRVNRKDSVSSTRESNSLDFFYAIMLFKELMIQHKKFDDVKDNFYLWALKYCMWNINSIKGDSFRQIFLFLKEEGFQTIGLNQEAIVDNFNSEKEYEQYQHIQTKEILDYLIFERDGFSTKIAELNSHLGLSRSKIADLSKRLSASEKIVNDQAVRLQQAIRELDKQRSLNDRILQSYSYKVGRIIAFLPRQLKQQYLRIKENMQGSNNK